MRKRKSANHRDGRKCQKYVYLNSGLKSGNEVAVGIKVSSEGGLQAELVVALLDVVEGEETCANTSGKREACAQTSLELGNTVESVFMGCGEKNRVIESLDNGVK